MVRSDAKPLNGYLQRNLDRLEEPYPSWDAKGCVLEAACQFSRTFIAVFVVDFFDVVDPF